MHILLLTSIWVARRASPVVRQQTSTAIFFLSHLANLDWTITEVRDRALLMFSVNPSLLSWTG
jgi:hypothetical protein